MKWRPHGDYPWSPGHGLCVYGCLASSSALFFQYLPSAKCPPNPGQPANIRNLLRNAQNKKPESLSQFRLFVLACTSRFISNVLHRKSLLQRQCNQRVNRSLTCFWKQLLSRKHGLETKGFVSGTVKAL